MKTLYLYGPPASGKSTLARQLARQWGRQALDLDDEIVRRAGVSIPALFAAQGEAGFRRLERETLRAATAPIIALGGGTLLDPENRAFVEREGIVAVLETSDEEIARRIAGEKQARPLGDRAADRRAHYASFAHRLRADTKILLPRLLRGRRVASSSPLIDAFGQAANALGHQLALPAGGDAAVASLLRRISAAADGAEPVTLDLSPMPDLYPLMAVVAAVKAPGRVRFAGTERFAVGGRTGADVVQALLARPEEVETNGDGRVAAAAALYATVLPHPMLLHGASCVERVCPAFWTQFSLAMTAVTGWPLAVTRSPEIFNAAAARAGWRAEMVSFPSETIEAALAFAAQVDLKGLAVTIPHKERVLAYLDEIEPLARAVGAVNTVVFREGRKKGYNTDVHGFSAAVTAFLGRTSLEGVRAAVLGAGGAAKAVVAALTELGAEVRVFHRQPLEKGFSLIVNATPVDPIADYRFTGEEQVYDLRYDPPLTPLLARARAAGCRVENGLSMLVEQARRQRELFALDTPDAG